MMIPENEWSIAFKSWQLLCKSPPNNPKDKALWFDDCEKHFKKFTEAFYIAQKLSELHDSLHRKIGGES